ncbi:alpha/beta hydrolase [Nocardia vaccinii]|uniref:alpha/beta hydrolase n=1 Tax=Nocardia vaccinii TaxID=1822 RepID=UPI001C3F8735|nr:DUF3887 domain-containing protein [Nocardia vaccinii]
MSETVAATVVELLRTERFGELEALFAPRLAAAVSAETVRAAWAEQVTRLGAIDELGAATTRPRDGGLTLVIVPVRCERGSLHIRLAVDANGRLHGFRIAASSESDWTPPQYVSTRRFTERAVTPGPESRAVPGTLTLPKGLRGGPGVVLVASGPSDRDVTTGPNKPFKDLAWGLASRGVAVVRFDKLTLVHPELGSEPGFTMVEEYLPDIRAAVDVLRQDPHVDPDRIFLVGHSGGGKAAVRAAAADPSIAGVAILAGDTVPLPRAALRVFEYLAGLDTAPDMTGTLDAAAITVARTEDPDLSPDAPAADLLFGWPASYWLDLRAYDQVATAADLHRPVLVLQGGRDYQVTAADDLPAWRAGLAANPAASIRILDADDHMFFPGTGPSTPADYQAPRHVDPAVVAAIAEWVAPGHKRSPFGRLLTRLAR